VNAVLSELNQLHIRKVLEPKQANDLSKEEKRGALQYLMFLKQKRCGKLKGWGYVDGGKQQEHTSKDEAASPRWQ
jgi:hypothetical protein